MAVADCFLALWSTVLHSDPEDSTWNAGDILAALARSFSDPSPFLAVWQNVGSLSSALQLADLLQFAWSLTAQRKPLSRNLPFGELLQRWLTDRARLIALKHAIEQHLDHPASSRLAAAIDTWQWICHALGESRGA